MVRTSILAALALASTAASAQPRGNVQLPIAPGHYVWEGEPCGRAGSIFRYDGRRAGWYGAEAEGDMVGDIRRVRRAGSRYVVRVTGRDAEGEVQDGLIDLTVTLLGRGRIAAQLEAGPDSEVTPLRLCQPASLPRWGRRF